MKKPIHVLITLPFKENLIQNLRDISDDLVITYQPALNAEDISPEVWEQTQVLYTLQVLPEPEQVPNLRWIQYHLAGADRLLEAPIVQKEDLQITTMSGANAPQVAEHALTLLLTLCRQVPSMVTLKNQIQWMKDKHERYQPQTLRGKTIGIVGYGSIGRQIARLLTGFGAQVLAAKRNVMQPEDHGYTPPGTGDPEGELFTRLYPVQALRSMFSDCHHAIITLPLTKDTRGLVSKNELAALPKTAFVIDVSRGGILDHQALADALNAGELAGAGLDVYPVEPLPKESPLWKTPNLIISPHVAGYSQQYDQQAAVLFADNLNLWLDEMPLYNLLDISRGY